MKDSTLGSWLRHAAPLLIVLLPLAVVVATPSAAFAQGDEGAATAAGNRFQRGIDLYEEGDFEGALIEFQRAYDLSPRYPVLYNIALTQYQLLDYAGALTTLQKYLKDGGSDLTADKREAAKKEIAKMESRVGTVEVVIDQTGAKVTIDGREVGVSPLGGPLLVSIGRRTIEASLAGRTVNKSIDVGGGDSLRVELVVPTGVESPNPAPNPNPTVVPGPIEAPSKPEGETSYTGAIVAWVATGALVVGTVVFGVVALSASSDLKDMRAQFPSDPNARADAAAKTERLAIVADVMLAASVVMGGVAIYLTATAGPDAPAETVQLNVGPGSLSLSGSF